MKSIFTFNRVAMAAALASSSFLFSQGCWKELPRPGHLHSFGITENDQLYGWGKNTFYELGDGTQTPQYSPKIIGNGVKWLKAEGTGATQAGIQEDGTLWTWGDILGGSFEENKIVTKLGTDTDWAEVSVGSYFVIMLKKDGSMWSVGTNSGGVLGLSGKDSSYKTKTPERIGTDTWKAISAGTTSVLAIKSDGTLWTWGNSVSGLEATQYTPKQVGTDTDWAMISTGASHALAIKTNGDLYGWGTNSTGEVGLGHTYSVKTPTKIGTDKWKKANAAKNTSSLGVKQDGTLWTWGDNTNQKLGLDIPDLYIQSPRQVGTDTNWVDAKGGLKDFSLALKTDKTLWGTGTNSNGNLGDGTQIAKVVFTKVSECPYDPRLSTIEAKKATSLSIYPNPVKDIFTIDTKDKLKSVEIYSATGQRVFYSQEKQNNISSLAKGVYWVKVTTNKGSISQKIIKQ